MQDQLDYLRKQFDAAAERVQALESRFSIEDWRRKTKVDGWSAIECIEHLNITSSAFIPRLSEALSKAPSLTSPKSFHLDLPGWMLVKMLGSRARLSRTKTNASFIPSSGPDTSSTLSQFKGHQNELITLLDIARKKEIDKVKVQSPFRENIRYHVFSAFSILAIHETRHLDQAERASRRN